MELNRKWVGVGGGGQRHGTLDPHRAKIETGGRCEGGEGVAGPRRFDWMWMSDQRRGGQ